MVRTSIDVVVDEEKDSDTADGPRWPSMVLAGILALAVMLNGRGLVGAGEAGQQ